jgi:hypothetical protein
MKRSTGDSVLRWVLISLCLAVYWLAVVAAVVDARQNAGDPKHMEWLLVILLTAPWSCAMGMLEPAPNIERAWWTAVAVAGGSLNSMLFVWLVRRLAGVRPPPPDPEVANYDDGPPGG